MAIEITPLIPKGYIRIVCSEPKIQRVKTEIFFNRKEGRFFVLVDGMLMGPVTLRQLEVLNHAIKDTIDLNGRYGEI